MFSSEKHPPAEARIWYKFDGETNLRETTWRDGEEGPGDIAHLSVFDSHNARLYVDERNRIDYLPHEIELLTCFGQLLTSLSEKLASEISVVEDRLRMSSPKGFTEGTKVSEMVNRLTLKTNLTGLPTIKEIDDLGIWTSESEQDLKNVERIIGVNPVQLAERYHRVQNVVANLTKELTSVRDALSNDKVKELMQAVSYARSTDKAANLVTTELFKNEPLPHVGSEPWQLMFQYAKEYSVLAYPDMELPETLWGELCVLCQQPLAKDAVDRLQRFEHYVAGEAMRKAQEAKTDQDTKFNAIKSVQIRSVNDIETLLSEYAGLSDQREEIAVSIKKFLESAHERQKKLQDAFESGDFSEMADFDDSVIKTLHNEEKSLQEEISAFSVANVAEMDSDQENKIKRLASLLDRKLLSKNLKLFHARRDDLELRIRLKECMSACKTNAVSRQVSAMRKDLVTEALNNRIRAEINNLDLSHIPMLINDDSRRGESGFQVTLDSRQKVSSRDVLSEGEQRALGLACFLADVNGQPVKHGIIVDDPVSSLDHVRLRRVANRLVNEAAEGRQVIIFTHNLLFFSEVLSCAAAHSPKQVPVLRNIVRKADEIGFGVIEEDDDPWEAKEINKRIIVLRKKIRSLESMADMDSDVYRQALKGFYTDLRESWERLVEEMLLFKVVERYGSDVKTQRLKGVEIEDEDYKTIYWAIKRVSEYSGHDIAAAKSLPFPKIEDLKKEVNQLDDYRNSLKNRSKATEKRRENLEKPPKAAVAKP